jgi:kinesin family member 21
MCACCWVLTPLLTLWTDREQGLDATPPSSPPTYRRSASREEKNVFSRLTSTTGVTRDEKPGHGVISQFGGRVRRLLRQSTGFSMRAFKFQVAHKCPLICTHVAEGHSKAVLSVDATEDLLFSSSKGKISKYYFICGPNFSKWCNIYAPF